MNRGDSLHSWRSAVCTVEKPESDSLGIDCVNGSSEGLVRLATEGRTV